MDKIDFKKKYKSLYAPSNKTPSIVEVPPLNYAVLEGVGDPNTSELFSKSIEALYSLSYAISMSYKNDSFNIPQFYNFVVAPLEGIWSIEDGTEFIDGYKDNFKWTIGILQPEFVTADIFAQAKDIAFNKKKNELINNIELTMFDDGLCCTMMHLGEYDNEPATFNKMQTFAEENGYERTEKIHREIYISDFRKVAPEKLKTVLRFKVKKK